MSMILFTMLQRWAAEKTSDLIGNGLIVALDDSQEFSAEPRLVLELENRRYLARLTLKEDGSTALECLDKKAEKLQQGTCAVFTEGQLESAVGHLLEWMGEQSDQPDTQPVVFNCPDQKAVYVSRGEARMIKKRARLPGTVVEYKCQRCGNWHLGDKKSRGTMKRRTFRS
jgi:hypothetical protein